MTARASRCTPGSIAEVQPLASGELFPFSDTSLASFDRC
jgi:hypothetical protein